MFGQDTSGKPRHIGEFARIVRACTSASGDEPHFVRSETRLSLRSKRRSQNRSPSTLERAHELINSSRSSLLPKITRLVIKYILILAFSAATRRSIFDVLAFALFPMIEQMRDRPSQNELEADQARKLAERCTHSASNKPLQRNAVWTSKDRSLRTCSSAHTRDQGFHIVREEVRDNGIVHQFVTDESALLSKITVSS